MMASLEDFIQLEQTSASLSLGLSAAPRGWSELIAGAQGALSRALVTLRRSAESTNGTGKELSAAARILDSASRPVSELTSDERRYAALLALQAFALDANTPSALAVSTRFPELIEAGTDSERISVATAAPSQIGRVLRLVRDPTHRSYLEDLDYFLATGDPGAAERLRASLSEVLARADSPLESVLIGTNFRILSVLLAHSVTERLSESTNPLLSHYVNRLVNEGIRTLLPPQISALTNGLLEGNENAVVAIPTSTGKTLLAELALVNSLESGPGIACYVAPFVAIGRQVAASLRRRLLDVSDVHSMFGAYRLPRPLNPEERREIVVCTPERFDALLRGYPEIFSHLRCVVFDEAHLIGNGERGIRLEGTISRLLMKQESGSAFRIVFLSAVVSNPQDLAEWLKADPSNVTTSNWRPSTKRTMFWGEDGRLRMVLGDDQLRLPSQSAASVLGTIGLPWPKTRFYRTSNFGQLRAQQSDAYENIAYLVRYLLARNEGSALVVAGSRRGSRLVADLLSAEMPSQEPIPPKISELMSIIAERHRYLRSLYVALSTGVAYHNAALPREVREMIEDAARGGELKVVTATTTLAEGVDLPFRFTVLADWLMPTDAGQQPMDPLLFRNISGRSGRAGSHTEGITILYDNVVGQPGLVAPQVRENLQRQIYASDQLPALQSSLAQSGDGNQLSVLSTAAISSNFLAAIAENPDSEDLVADLYRTHYASQSSAGPRLFTALQEVRSNLLSGERPFATAASPLQLTTLGVAANLTGLSPETCRAIIDLLPVREWHSQPLHVVAAEVLRRLAAVPEQTNVKLRRRLEGARNTRYVIQDADLEPLLENWMAGMEEESLFMDLAYVRRSRRTPTISEWMSGAADSATWPDEYESFMDFRSGTLSGFLPWALRGCGSLERAIGQPQVLGLFFTTDWDALADFIETGTSNRWAAAAIREGAPGGREMIVRIGQQFEDLADPADPLLLRVSDVVRLQIRARFGSMLEVFPELSEMEISDLRRIEGWYFNLDTGRQGR